MNHSKDQHLIETLSALMDGENDDLELRRLLKQLPDSAGQAEILDTWRRFHLVRSAMQGEPVSAGDSAASRRIIDAIAQEPAHQGVRQSRGRGQLVARLAIAASVAVAVFLGMQTALDPSGTVPADSMVAGGSESRTPEGSTEVTRFDAEAQLRLNEYIQNVSIQYANDDLPQLNVFDEIPALRPVSQIELDSPRPVSETSDSLR